MEGVKEEVVRRVGGVVEEWEGVAGVVDSREGCKRVVVIVNEWWC